MAEPKVERKANRRGAARLAAVQALYQMDIAGAGFNEILAEFESHWLGREVEGDQYLPAEAAFFRDMVEGVMREQRRLDPLIDKALAQGWPLKRIEAVLRAVLRAGAYELDRRSDVPARVGDLGICRRRQCLRRKDETAMINAVLDQLARQLRAEEFEQRGRMASAAPAEAESGEDRLIAKYFKPLARHPGAFGLTDDAAILTPPPGHDLVLKADAIIGGVHFFSDDPADAVARKALRVNLSDLAAKGAEPAGFLLSLALPASTDEAWLASFAHGLGEDAERYGCPLLGGDTDRTPGPAMISITAFGLVPHGRMVPRSGARVGDAVMVTGTIGDAVLGLALRREPDRAAAWGLDAALREHLAARYLLPQPRNAIAAVLRAHASAPWTCRTGSSATLASCAAPPGWRPTSRLRACRCRRPRGRRWRRSPP